MNEDLILLVEDNPNDETLALRSLKNYHINKVVVTRDGSEAVDYLFGTGRFASRDSRDLPRLILLDLKLPKLGGLEVLRRLRADVRTRLVPVVIWTSSGEEEDLKAGYTIGCNSYVQKPVDFTEFSETLRQVTRYWLEFNLPPSGV